MKKPTGRKPNLPPELMRIVAEKVISGELTFREAARIYQTSHGSVWAIKNKYGDGTPISYQYQQTANLPRAKNAENEAFELEMKQLLQEISKLDEQIDRLKKFSHI
jgi:transposase